jgi:hypothetical protein
MIAIQKANRHPTQSEMHAKFLEMLPRIQRQARIAFRDVLPEAREELIAETTGIAYSGYCRLVERGKEDLAYATPLARFAIRRVRSCRFLGGRQRPRDIYSPHAQHTSGFSIERLGGFDQGKGEWQEILVEDRKCGPSETAICRIDFSNWLRQLPNRLRRIALMLANGETTSAAAKKFGVTAARISQLRLWLRQNWEGFQGQMTVT